MKLERISIRHVWTKETNSLEVITVTRHIVTFKWPLSGVYDLHLATGRITVRSIAAQRKNGSAYILWEASDIVAVRKMVGDHLAGEDRGAVMREHIARHEATKPK